MNLNLKFESICLPSTITLAANFGVDNVQSRLAGEVLKILDPE
jgi:hypothetical protein